MSLRTFASEALNDWQTTAAVAPSSRFLVRAMLDPLPLHRAHTVVEFGPGTGVMTKELLKRLPQGATVFAFEINPRFARYLGEKIHDPRLVLVNDCAETTGAVLRKHGVTRVDAVVSSLGLTIMPDLVRTTIFENLVPYLDDDSVLTQFQYLHSLLLHPRLEVPKLNRYSTASFLRRYFGPVSRRFVWGNLPPAVVFTCRL